MLLLLIVVIVSNGGKIKSLLPNTLHDNTKMPEREREKTTYQTVKDRKERPFTVHLTIVCYYYYYYNYYYYIVIIINYVHMYITLLHYIIPPRDIYCTELKSI